MLNEKWEDRDLQRRHALGDLAAAVLLAIIALAFLGVLIGEAKPFGKGYPDTRKGYNHTRNGYQDTPTDTRTTEAQ